MSDIKKRPAPVDIECRALAGMKLEMRGEGESKIPVIVGYAAKFNSDSEVMNDYYGPFKERILTGAYDDCMEDDVRALLNHDINMILGRTTVKTLVLSIDSTGLRYEIFPPETTYAKNLIQSLRRGDISGSSFRFKVAKDGDTWAYEDGMDIRLIKKYAYIKDVGPVTFPAYIDTEAGTRSSESRDKYIDSRNEGALRTLRAKQNFMIESHKED